MRSLAHIYRLGVKELYSLRHDPVLVFLILYTFTFAIYTVATGVKTEVRNASIAFVDEDGTELSRRMRDAFLWPYFKPAALLPSTADIDRAMDAGKYTFVVVIPSRFQADLVAGRHPTLQLDVDATAMTLAGNGTTYITTILQNEISGFAARSEGGAALPVSISVRSKFNPNLESSWFMAVMQIVGNITMLSLILSGAAVIREREHGTIEHLLVMPVTPAEIMLAKIWANGSVIVAAALLSLVVVVQGLLAVTIAGSIMLFLLGTALFLFAMSSLGIALATLARSMPQFGLLAIPFFVVMNMLSGGVTPQEGMPAFLRMLMQASPSTHFTSFSQAVLYRGAGVDVVWPQLAAMTLIGTVLFVVAVRRFRNTMAVGQS
ncbi:ABC transporter permease subunit [Hyphomicrobium sp. xq]|uniref:ABC transporter permease subunit n=1 Tax=Hyphomicrobium album TaxID=2665159 RepID=A0A6I3KJ91_9HYPH|nr:ABC transporter permease [Hyphomicrobium album]MTD95785.1 ABC transporter permease subunit [Hyphomicrobium album]